MLGLALGDTDGTCSDGITLGDLDGLMLGDLDGLELGLVDGLADGARVGLSVGLSAAVGLMVNSPCSYCPAAHGVHDDRSTLVTFPPPHSAHSVAAPLSA